MFFSCMPAAAMTASPISPPARRIAVGGFTNQTPGQTPGLTADQWLATLTAQDTDAGLRLTDGDSFGLTLAGLTTASLSADYFLIL